MILCDRLIAELSRSAAMIDPFAQRVQNGVVSYGLSSFGYDIRVADEFFVVAPNSGVTLDPKGDNRAGFARVVADAIVIPPHSFVLARSLERLRIPRNVLGVVFGKSTYARLGLVVNVTPLEPEWEGHITMELSNTAPLPLRVYANEGIAQVVFLRGDDPIASYADRKGKYQNQVGVTLPRTD